ncbi:MAG: imelysin family protein [Pseudophaeobacter sp. bin_em_oilr2.035]|uniref:Imelysin family protein n=1 Tax=Phaeobacter gallaeciensis TaxID=60890 RepID=A0ABD4XCR8_9RHOB|nr:imelysin family protein [Phaeobacter gallaeciensis]MDF1772065.1 imelysin family protein [Pseudophaeobacter sp. bin_em_oilr2.035]MDE4146116.1 imelysin family protein [Phaeobacter gallaeciensis]MDE4158789.1 imelysin family protein [Phaeobacter gallaeciensis]MDE4162966.1 imelysin family protein [Phaeobacter gallaeciensis]MDE4167196.1 imelysin family protein [Phaeobacter gallaeciensis]
MTRPSLSRLLAPALALSLALPLTLTPATAQAGVVEEALEQHILPGFETLAQEAQQLSATAAKVCDPGSVQLQQAYGEAFDAWVAVSHLRFGPTERDNRAFALAFWPDSRGKTPKALRALITAEDPIAKDAAAYTSVSIAARGFYALEFLLYDTDMQQQGSADYRCQLTRAIAEDIATTADVIWTDWRDSYADKIRHPGDRYRSEAEVKQELFKALNTGLQILIDMRLGRPLGTYDRPRPKRAEAYRSGRSQHHVILALEALAPLARILSDGDADLTAKLDGAFDTAIKHAKRLDDPTFAGVAEPGTRLRIEAVQQDIRKLRETIGEDLGPALGVEAGFNALDGD